MTIRRASNGNALSKTQLMALLTTNTPERTYYTVTEDINQDYNNRALDGNRAKFETDRRRLFHAGQVISDLDIAEVFPTAVVSSITPTSGPAAGSTPFTLRGSGLAGVTGVTFGGTAATSVVVRDDGTVTGVTPAKTAGAYNVVVADDGDNVTKTNFYTYT